MHESNKYVLKHETVLFLPEYDVKGNLCTIGLENGKPFLVNMSPTALVDYNLRYYGSSLRGANEGSRMILGNSSMYPIVVNEMLDIYWFPSMSPNREACIWFAAHHIQDYKGTGKKKTKVLLSDKSTITIDVSVYSFDKKIQKTYLLKCKLEGRTKKNIMMTKESRSFYYIHKEKDGRNYQLIVKE